MSLRESADARVISARKSLREQLSQLWTYRGLLRRMVRKELQVKYKNSVLGFLWSLLNPALYLVIFTVVFQFILGSGIPRYAIFLLSGLLVWNFFSMAVGSATTSISHNGPLVGKVYFPREVMPLASVGAALVHFFLQTTVLVAAVVVIPNHHVAFAHLIAVPAALAILVVLVTGIALLLAAANVYLRDMEHFVELALLAWFWMTPIVYPHQFVADQLADKSWAWVQWLNPLTSIVLVFQRGFYNVLAAVGGRPTAKPIPQAEGDVTNILPTDMDLSWYATHLGLIAVVAFALLVAGFWVFGRVEGNFAEEL